MKLYYQSYNHNIPLWTFCYSAKLGAEYSGIETISFEDADDIMSIRKSSTNIIVGSVEMTRLYLGINGFTCPKSIDEDLDFNGLYYLFGRVRTICSYEELKKLNFEKPFFVKPHGQIKAFNGFVVDSPKCLKEIDFYLDGYCDLFQIQEVVEFISEWRAYVLNDKIIGVGCYKGDPTIFPDKKFIDLVLSESPFQNISAYTIDFGVNNTGESLVVEFNDGWAIENYALSPENYFDFVKTRWLQITGKTD